MRSRAEDPEYRSIRTETTIVLSVSFFLTVVSDMTPPTSESVPLLGESRYRREEIQICSRRKEREIQTSGMFFSCVTCIVSASAAFTITVLNLRYRNASTHRFGRIVRLPAFSANLFFSSAVCSVSFSHGSSASDVRASCIAVDASIAQSPMTSSASRCP